MRFSKTIIKIEFVFLLVICPILMFSQEIIKNADGSVSIISKSMIYLDTSGKLLDEILFQDSLKTGNYDVTLMMKSSGVENQLKKINSAEDYPELQSGKTFPLLELVDINQNKINTEEKTELTLLTFWNITCKPCIEELIIFDMIADEYPEVNFIAMTSTSKQNVKNFFHERDINWKNLIVISDCQEYFEKFEILSVPLNIIIDKNGIIKKIFVGKNIRKILSSFEDLKVKEPL